MDYETKNCVHCERPFKRQIKVTRKRQYCDQCVEDKVWMRRSGAIKIALSDYKTSQKQANE